jgi:hypothetical protein
MKRSTFIVILFIIILILFGAWVYSLLYGSPETRDDLFASFNFFGGSDQEVVPFPITEPASTTPDVVTVPTDTAKLRKLTTQPVIGFYESPQSSSTPRTVIYVEAGTGHVYEINMENGEERRISNVTVPTAIAAAISPDGKYVAIRSGYTNNSEIVLVTLGTEPHSTILEVNASDFSFSAQNELLVAETVGEGTSIRSINPLTQASRPLFTIPFQQATVAWSQFDTTPHYTYPKPAALLPGYMYELILGTIKRIPVAGQGLSGEGNTGYIIYSDRNNEFHRSGIYNKETGEKKVAPIIFTPDKCVFLDANSATLYCGYDLGSSYTYEFPDNWFRGDVAFNDRIWKIDLAKLTATQIVNPLEVAGQEIDIINMSINTIGTQLYFLNKHDNSLWTYEI